MLKNIFFVSIFHWFDYEFKKQFSNNDPSFDRRYPLKGFFLVTFLIKMESIPLLADSLDAELFKPITRDEPSLLNFFKTGTISF